MGVLAQQRSVVRGIVEQGSRLGDFLVSLRPAEFLRPVPGTDVQVHDVTAQLLVTQTALRTALDQATTQRPSSLVDYCHGMTITRHRTEKLAREIADHDSGPTLATQFQQAQHEVALRLAAPDLPDVVAVGRSALRTVDLLRLSGQEWVVHADDLTRALPGHRPVGFPRAVFADAVRFLAELLRSRHPGRSIEIRVPPFTAVQCGTPGEPTHTRGTPPTVVECDPLAFLRLCRGRESWTEALKHNHVTASGVRADISEWLPLF